MSDKPILCLDFDGVVHSYTSGWKGATVIPDPPVKGTIAFIERALEQFDVQIFSSRSRQPGGIDAMKRWLREHAEHYFDCSFGGAPRDFDRMLSVVNGVSFPDEKPPAMVTIDDRGLTFDGDWSAPHWTPKALLAFKPWFKRERAEAAE